MQDEVILDAVVQWAREAERKDASVSLANALDVDGVLLFVRDPELGVMLPAPGLAQTLPGGPLWRELLARCAAERGAHEGEVPYPTRDRLCKAVAIADDVVFVTLGRRPEPSRLAAVTRVLPLVARMLIAEKAQVAAAGEREIAREAARESSCLAVALDRARNELQRNLIETARLNRELENAHQRKDEFLAMLAHELRNPLAPMVTALHLLELREEVKVIGERELGLLRRQLAHLGRLVDDLLDVSRITRGRIDLRREVMAVQDVVQRAVESVRPSVAARRHELSITVPDTPLFVDADAVRLVQVFGNLLHNAAKYTDPGGHVRIEVERDGAEIIVRVVDDGVGIAPDMLSRVFDLFVQAQRSLDRAQGGLGIGLRLVQALVDLHGGNVRAHSEGFGKGSCFEVRLPLVADRSATMSALEKQAPARTPASALRVLIVDDNRDAASSLGDLVTALGHTVDVAYDGLVALQVAADYRPDLVVLDIGLPTLDGFEVARRLRLSSRDIYLVALTGYGRDADHEAARDAGFDEYVVKPIEADRLGELLGVATVARDERLSA